MGQEKRENYAGAETWCGGLESRLTLDGIVCIKNTIN